MLLQARTDVLAAGYASKPLAADSPGRVAVWSANNTEHPLWSVATASCVTSLDFASQTPGLLAVGAYDGSLTVFDLKSKQVSFLADSGGSCLGRRSKLPCTAALCSPVGASHAATWALLSKSTVHTRATDRAAAQATPMAAAQPASKHWGPLWHLRWLARASQGEVLISSSADGRMTQWSLSRVRPGLCCSG